MSKEIPREPKQLREYIKNFRQNLSINERSMIFEAITTKFLTSLYYKNAVNVLAYVGKESSGEFNTEPLLQRILNEKKHLALPKVRRSPIGLELYDVSNTSTDLALGNFQIMEPIPERCQKIALNQIDLAIIPGLVFDRNGTRYGYGRGYYDRLFSDPSASKLIKIAFAYSKTVMEFPLLKNQLDVPMDILITEHEIIECRQKPKN